MPEKRDEKLLLLIFAGHLFFYSILLLGKRPFVYVHTLNAHVSCVIRILKEEKYSLFFSIFFKNSNTFILGWKKRALNDQMK